MAGIKRLQGENEEEYGRRVRGIVESLDHVVMRNGRVVARFPSKYRTVPYAADELTGIIKGNYDLDEVKSEALREKYGLAY